MARPTRYPMSAFFANPKRSGATISPDGKQLGFLAEEHGRLNVWVLPFDSAPNLDDAVCVTHDHNRNITRYRWTADPRWLLYEQDTDGDENWHLFRVDLDDPAAAAVDLTPYPDVRVEYTMLASDPHAALIAMNRRRADVSDVFRLDIVTGEMELVAENPGDVIGWVLSASGTIVARVNTGTAETLYRWRPDDRDEITSYDAAENPLGAVPMVITPDGTGLWLGSNRDREHTRLVHIDFETRAETVVASRDDVGVDETSNLQPVAPPLICDAATGKPLAVRFLGERQQIEVIDPDFQPVLDAIMAVSDGTLTQCTGDLTGRWWLVSFATDVDPGATYLYDHETGSHRLLFRPYPQLSSTELAAMQSIRITSRDGLELPGLLTLPQGVEPTGLPLVLLVHGGPWSRDRWGYHAGTQALANRGYAVLRVNFRGSTGFGKSLTTAGLNEFAGKMHHDLIDAAEWAVKQGIADPTRIAIFGGSYGGYSALVGATFTPDFFACAIDFCGISHLPNFSRALPVHLRHWLSWDLYIGDPDIAEQEADMLARSPISRVDAITRPLLVIHGAKDRRVLQEESDSIVEQLRARDADVEYLLKPNEGHGFVNPENNIALYETITAFLARTIGSAYPDAVTA
ncbi:MAG TPA: S9 family peptidase [Mycobacteriales bacterium]|nr:S9 family peptidase [Mycobacteriales bacterium]